MHVHDRDFFNETLDSCISTLAWRKQMDIDRDDMKHFTTNEIHEWLSGVKENSLARVEID